MYINKKNTHTQYMHTTVDGVSMRAGLRAHSSGFIKKCTSPMISLSFILQSKSSSL